MKIQLLRDQLDQERHDAVKSALGMDKRSTRAAMRRNEGKEPNSCRFTTFTL